jgi:sugar/nucleoside kinase (ribokinase family)
MDIVVVGDINADLVLTGLTSLPALHELKHAENMKLTLGGSSAIFAYNIARLGVATGFVGKVGKDHLGDFLLDTLNSVGVDTSHVVRDSALPTGVCVVMSFPQDYAMVSYPGIRNSFVLSEIDLEYVKRARQLHVSGFYLQPGLHAGCLELFQRAKAAGLTTSLDPDHDPTEEWDNGIRQLLPLVDLFFPNEIEAIRIANAVELDESTSILADLGHTIVIKVGANGVRLSSHGESFSAPAFKVQPVDTTGAGDSFDAGFIFQHLQGSPLQKCLAWGNACGALSTRALGGIDAFPSVSEVKTFLAQQQAAYAGGELASS